MRTSGETSTSTCVCFRERRFAVGTGQTASRETTRRACCCDRKGRHPIRCRRGRSRSGTRSGTISLSRWHCRTETDSRIIGLRVEGRGPDGNQAFDTLYARLAKLGIETMAYLFRTAMNKSKRNTGQPVAGKIKHGMMKILEGTSRGGRSSTRS